MYVHDDIFTADINESDVFGLSDVCTSNFDASSTSSCGFSKEDLLFQTINLDSPGTGQRHARTLAPNLTRRSHKKSRAGCYTCKGRKIKCGEQKPKCGNCLMKGLSCVYPTAEQPRKRSDPLPLAKRVPAGNTPGTALFTMLDMKFFHHFLTTAYPHLPVGNNHVWVNEIPQFAEHQEYLMHAILSLGASHLGRLTDIDYRTESLTHRGQAIAGLNKALSQKAQHYGESDAMLAACYALTFQASYMGDGLEDFITMVRGCALTTEKIRKEDAPTAFNLQPDWHFKVMAPRLASLPPVNHTLLEQGIAGLEDIQPYLETGIDYDFHRALTDTISALLASPQSGYMQFVGVYAVWYELCHDSFETFLDPNNLIVQLLLSYFISIQMLMAPLAAHEWPDHADSSKKAKSMYGTVEWAENIFRKLDATVLSAHLGWPKRIVGIVVKELGGDALFDEAIDGPSVLQLGLTTMTVSPIIGSIEDGMEFESTGFWEEVTRNMEVC